MSHPYNYVKSLKIWYFAFLMLRILAQNFEGNKYL